jgi:hypothetical protein
MNQTLNFAWYVVRCEACNKHHKDMRIKEIIELHAHKMLDILGSIINMMGGIYMTTQ